MKNSMKQPRGTTEDRFFLDLLDKHEEAMGGKISAEIREDINEMLRLQSGMSLPTGLRRHHRETHITPEARRNRAERLRTKILNGFAVNEIYPELRRDEK